MTAIALPPTRLVYPRGFSENALRRALEQFPAHQELREIARIFGGGFRAPFAKPIAAGDAAAAVPWYLTGGIALANCVAAYCPKGSASLAASYSNLVSPGTNNAAPGVAPTFDATTGWTFDGATQYLTTGVTPAANWSMMLRLTNWTSNGDPMGSVGASNTFFRFERFGNIYYGYGAGTQVNKALPGTAGVYALTPQGGYFNGALDLAITPGAMTSAIAIYLGAGNNFGSAGDFTPVKIQAAAVYNIDISSYAAALATAMAAL